MTSNGSISIDVDVAAEPRDAFLHFTQKMGHWWPKHYSWSGETLREMIIGNEPGGFCTEVGPLGFRCDFGRVLEIEPPKRIVFTWQVGPNREPVPDPSKASKIEVTFAARADGTRVTLSHTGFSNHGAGAEQYREAMQSDQGWPLILRRFAEACSAKAEQQ